MTDPAAPKETDNLLTPSMESPHESLELNEARGLAVAMLSRRAARARR